MRKIISVFVALICGIVMSTFAQNQVHYATFWSVGATEDACVFSLYPNTNYNSEQELNMLAWTWQGRFGKVRSLLKFTGLNNIPDNATILSATLRLEGVSSGNITPQGNNYYTGTSYNNTNEVLIYRLTQPWNTNTVTWNNQPAFDNSNSIVIPASTQQWNESYSNSSPTLVSMVQQMVQANNDGFILILNNEARYRSRIFASSHHENSKLHPSLFISYIYCDANFSYCVNSSEQNIYTFTAETTDAIEYTWSIDGTFEFDDVSFEYPFVDNDTHVVCLNVLNQDSLSCEKCISIMALSSAIVNPNETASLTKSKIAQNKIPQADIIEPLTIRVYPNPSIGVWNVELLVEIHDLSTKKYRMIVTDSRGNIVKQANIDNTNFKIDLSNQDNGIYSLKVLMEEQEICIERLIKAN